MENFLPPSLPTLSLLLLTLGCERFLSKEAHWKLERESIENQEEADPGDRIEPVDRSERLEPQLETE